MSVNNFANDLQVQNAVIVNLRLTNRVNRRLKIMVNAGLRPLNRFQLLYTINAQINPHELGLCYKMSIIGIIPDVFWLCRQIIM